MLLLICNVSDLLQGAEVDRTREAIANLSRVAWARPVIARLNKAGGIRAEMALKSRLRDIVSK